MTRTAVYEWHDAKTGMLIGCGSQFELNHWTAEGVYSPGTVTIGKIIGWESPEADTRRAAMWAKEAA